MNQKIFVLGTHHSLQCGCDPFTESDVEVFRKFIKELCYSDDIKFIAEEMSKDGLKMNSVQETICHSVASELNIDISYVDINQEMRCQLGIDDFKLRRAAIPDGQMRPDKKMEDMYYHHLRDPIRECSWLAHIITKNSWPCLFICGANHVKRIVDRAQSLGIETVLVKEDYAP